MVKFPIGLQDSECSWNNYILPTTLRPTQYDLGLEVQLKPPYQVTGQMQIFVNVTRPTRCMVLHAMGMNITGVRRADTDEAGT